MVNHPKVSEWGARDPAFMIIYLSKSAYFQEREERGEQRMFLLKQTYSNFLFPEVSPPASRGGINQAHCPHHSPHPAGPPTLSSRSLSSKLPIGDNWFLRTNNDCKSFPYQEFPGSGISETVYLKLSIPLTPRMIGRFDRRLVLEIGASHHS